MITILICGNAFERFDGGIPYAWGDSEDWSYARCGQDGYVEEVAEKKVISNDFTAGYYYGVRVVICS